MAGKNTVKQVQSDWQYTKVTAIKTGDGETGFANIRKVTKMQRGGRLIRKVTEYWQRVELNINGTIKKFGQVYMGNVYNTRTYTVELRSNGSNRLDNGFDTLMKMCRMGGVSQEDVQRIADKWDLLSENDKADVFNEYRTEANEMTFGSSAYDERAVLREDSQWYADTIEKIIDSIMEDVYIE